jgi:hypothetical protein
LFTLLVCRPFDAAGKQVGRHRGGA